MATPHMFQIKAGKLFSTSSISESDFFSMTTNELYLQKHFRLDRIKMIQRLEN